MINKTYDARPPHRNVWHGRPRSLVPLRLTREVRYGSHARPLNLVLSRHNRPFWTGRSFQTVTPASPQVGLRLGVKTKHPFQCNETPFPCRDRPSRKLIRGTWQPTRGTWRPGTWRAGYMAAGNRFLYHCMRVFPCVTYR